MTRLTQTHFATPRRSGRIAAGSIDRREPKRGVPIFVAALAAVALAGCGPSTTKYPGGGQDIQRTGDPYTTPQEKSGSVFGSDDGIVIFGENNVFQGEEGGGGQGIGVNSYLWRASLDTVSFMPLASADPFGGVIITDWHSPAETPDERFKVNVYILGRQLRGDGIRAAVFRQKRDLDGSWVDAPVDPQTATDLENAILTRARQLRIAGVE